MKLDAAGITFSSIPLASSSDHYCRTEIMRLAERRAGTSQYDSITYFGDGPWDQRASKALGYNFVSVGDRINSPKSVRDYTEVDVVLGHIGL